MNESVINQISYNEAGLVPVIVQQYNTGEVLMLAWMNSEALEKTRGTGNLHYFSRSRKALWKKGEQSGQRQHLVKLRLDCDGDALLALVDQTGVACHTGRRTCFYTEITGESGSEIRKVLKQPEQLYA